MIFWTWFRSKLFKPIPRQSVTILDSEKLFELIIDQCFLSGSSISFRKCKWSIEYLMMFDWSLWMNAIHFGSSINRFIDKISVEVSLITHLSIWLFTSNNGLWMLLKISPRKIILISLWLDYLDFVYRFHFSTKKKYIIWHN